MFEEQNGNAASFKSVPALPLEEVRRAEKSRDKALRDARDEPVAVLEDTKLRWEKMEDGRNRRLYRLLARTYASAVAMHSEASIWRSFTKHSFWSTWKRPPRSTKDLDKIARFCCLFVFDGNPKTNAANYSRAAKYAHILEFFHVKAVPARKIASTLEIMGGVEKVYERAKKELPKRKKSPQEVDADDVYSGIFDSERTEGNDISDDDPSNSKKGRSIPSLRKLFDSSDPASSILVEMDDRDQERLFRRKRAIIHVSLTRRADGHFDIKSDGVCRVQQ